MARWPKPPEGSWTEHYPELGTGPVSYEDSISPDFYELEREAIFKRAWLNVGRVDLVPGKGSYFTKELEFAKTSVVIVRDMEGEAPHYRIDGPHRLVSTSGIRPWELDDDKRKPMETITRSGLFGTWDKPDLGVDSLPPGLNPGGCVPWGNDSFRIFPNFVILILNQGWYLTYHYWPTSESTHIFEGTLYFVPAETAGERLAHEMAAVSFKEFGLQDANTLEATQSMPESRVVRAFPLRDQEVLCRHLHKVTADWVSDYQRDKVAIP